MYADLIKNNNKSFANQFNNKTELGILAKEDLKGEHKIYVRADLHGGLKDLLADLEALKQKGLLDDNYNPIGNVRFIFLGDYVDRGQENLQILELLITFRLKNPKYVVLLRGNHESVDMNYTTSKKDSIFKSYVSENDMLFSELYTTFLLANYIAQSSANANGKIREYAVLAHGGVGITTDVTSLLNNENSKATTPVLKSLKLSDNRIENLSKIIDEKKDYQKQLKITTCKKKRKILKRIIAIKKAKQFIKKDLYVYSIYTDYLGIDGPKTPYCWMDIVDSNPRYEVVQHEKGRGLQLCPKALLNILRLSSDEQKVKLLIKGHCHKQQNHLIEKQGKSPRVIAMILPVGSCLKKYKEMNKENTPSSFIFTTAEKIKDWKKQAIIHNHTKQTTKIAQNISIHTQYDSENYSLTQETTLSFKNFIKTFFNIM